MPSQKNKKERAIRYFEDFCEGKGTPGEWGVTCTTQAMVVAYIHARLNPDKDSECTKRWKALAKQRTTKAVKGSTVAKELAALSNV